MGFFVPTEKRGVVTLALVLALALALAISSMMLPTRVVHLKHEFCCSYVAPNVAQTEGLLASGASGPTAH